MVMIDIGKPLTQKELLYYSNWGFGKAAIAFLVDSVAIANYHVLSFIFIIFYFVVYFVFYFVVMRVTRPINLRQ